MRVSKPPTPFSGSFPERQITDRKTLPDPLFLRGGAVINLANICVPAIYFHLRSKIADIEPILAKSIPAEIGLVAGPGRDGPAEGGRQSHKAKEKVIDWLTDWETVRLSDWQTD